MIIFLEQCFFYSSRQLASSGVCLNKSKTDLGKDDGLFTGGRNAFVQLYPQTSHYSTTTSSGGPGGKTWNPLVKLKRFYLKMTDPRYNKKVDVYIYMFLCEFIAFWIMIFGYVSFGPSVSLFSVSLSLSLSCHSFAYFTRISKF